jgi:hypothetical protein
MTSFWRFAFWLLLLAALGGCSSEKIDCGGKISPDVINADALKIVKKAEIDSKAFCKGSDAGCTFTVAKTDQNWSVSATRVFAVDGKCVSRIGDEKFYKYDESGVLMRVIDGI